MLTDKTNLLFICLGNICRSPAAQSVMQRIVDDNHLTPYYNMDSAGIGNWHEGQLPDARMRRHGVRRGYDISHIARQFRRSDFSRFDYVIVMDRQNYQTITSMAAKDADRRKVRLLSDWFRRYKGESVVPDPYYGGDADFEWALDLIEDGCGGLLDDLENKRKEAGRK